MIEMEILIRSHNRIFFLLRKITAVHQSFCKNVVTVEWIVTYCNLQKNSDFLKYKDKC